MPRCLARSDTRHSAWPTNASSTVSTRSTPCNDGGLTGSSVTSSSKRPSVPWITGTIVGHEPFHKRTHVFDLRLGVVVVRGGAYDAGQAARRQVPLRGGGLGHADVDP